MSETIRKLGVLIETFPSLRERLGRITLGDTKMQFFKPRDLSDVSTDFFGGFDAGKFDRWAVDQSFGHGASCACQFVLSVWNYNNKKWEIGCFDIHDAMGCWDDEHRAAFCFWAEDPFWC